jgi:hypothetical protein
VAKRGSRGGPGVKGWSADEENEMTEVPGTDRDQARENVVDETPITPEGVEQDTSTEGDEGQAGDEAKPEAGSTDPVT